MKRVQKVVRRRRQGHCCCCHDHRHRHRHKLQTHPLRSRTRQVVVALLACLPLACLGPLHPHPPAPAPHHQFCLVSRPLILLHLLGLS